MAEQPVEDNKKMYCPRCDNLYPSEQAVRKHVEGQHPDHDPEWWDTYPNGHTD